MTLANNVKIATSMKMLILSIAVHRVNKEEHCAVDSSFHGADTWQRVATMIMDAKPQQPISPAKP